MSPGRLSPTGRAARLLAIGFLIPLTLAAQPGPKDRWITGHTQNFTVYSNAPQAKTRRITESLEQLRQVIEHLGSDVDAIERAPITLIIFKNERVFVPYMRTPPLRGTVRPWEAHYGESRDYLLLNASKPPAEVMPWAHGAYARYLIDIQYRQLPYWLRVGLGYFYGATEIRNGTVRIGIPVKTHIRRLRQQSMIPLAQFFRIESDSSFLDHPDNIGLYNAQVWALAHFLITGDGDIARGRQFFGAMSQGLAPEEAIRTLFGTDLKGFQKKLSSYINQSSMPIFTLAGDFLRDPELTLEPMTSGEASYQLGNYIVSAHEPPSIELVEAHFEPLVAAQGDRHGDALAAMAQLRHLTGRDDLAAELFEQSLVAGPEDPLSLYRYAMFLENSPGGEENVELRRTLLKRAVDIEPDFGMAWSKLAETYSSFSEVEEAIPLAERALALLPNRPSLAYNLAMMHVSADDTEAARAVVERYLNGEPRFRDQALEEIGRRELVQSTNRAVRSGDLDAAIASYRAAAEKATDAATRARMQSELTRLEQTRRTQKHGQAYNDAVNLANAGDQEESLQQLKALLPSVEDVSLRSSIESLISRLEQYLDGRP